MTFGRVCYKQGTRVSSWIRDKCATLLKLRMEFETFFSHFFDPYFLNIFLRTLNCHISIAFGLIPTLRARSENQLSADIHTHKAGTKFLHTNAQFVLVLSINLFCLCAAMVSQSHRQSKWLRP